MASRHAASGQFPYPQPSLLQPQSGVQMLSQELVAAQRRLLQYTDLISSLYTELDMIRSIVCLDCKQRINSPHLAQHPSVLAPQPLTTPSAQSQNIGSWQTTPIIPTAVTTPFSGRSSLSLPRNLLTPPPPPPILPTLSRSPVIPVISNVPTSSEASPPETAPTTSVIASPLVEKSQWSVTYSDKRSIDMTFVHEFKNTSTVYAVRFSPDGNLLAAGHSFDQVAKTHIYDVETRSTRCALTEYSGYSDNKQSRSRGVWSICFSPDGRYVAVVCSLEMIYVWEIASKRVLAALKGHVGAVRFLDISPDGRHLVTCSYDFSVRIWNLRDGSSKLHFFTRGYYFVSAKFSPNSRYVVASNLDGILRIWDVRSSHLVGSWDMKIENVWSLAFSPDEELLVTGGWGGVVKSWDINSLKKPARSGLSASTEEVMLVQKNERLSFDGHWGDVRSVSISPDGKWITTAASDRRVCIWDVGTAVLQCTVEGEVGLWAVDFSPAGNYIATGSDDGFVTLWRFQTV